MGTGAIPPGAAVDERLRFGFPIVSRREERVVGLVDVSISGRAPNEAGLKRANDLGFLDARGAVTGFSKINVAYDFVLNPEPPLETGELSGQLAAALASAAADWSVNLSLPPAGIGGRIWASGTLSKEGRIRPSMSVAETAWKIQAFLDSSKTDDNTTAFLLPRAVALGAVKLFRRLHPSRRCPRIVSLSEWRSMVESEAVMVGLAEEELEPVARFLFGKEAGTAPLRAGAAGDGNEVVAIRRTVWTGTRVLQFVALAAVLIPLGVAVAWFVNGRGEDACEASLRGLRETEPDSLNRTRRLVDALGRESAEACYVRALDASGRDYPAVALAITGLGDAPSVVSRRAGFRAMSAVAMRLFGDGSVDRVAESYARYRDAADGDRFRDRPDATTPGVHSSDVNRLRRLDLWFRRLPTPRAWREAARDDSVPMAELRRAVKSWHWLYRCAGWPRGAEHTQDRPGFASAEAILSWIASGFGGRLIGVQPMGGCPSTRDELKYCREPPNCRPGWCLQGMCILAW